MPKDRYPVTENGNSVTIELHVAGTLVQNKDLIASLIKKWQDENPNKTIVGNTDVVANSSGLHKRVTLNCIRFIWEPISSTCELKNPVIKEFCRTQINEYRGVLLTDDYSHMFSKVLSLVKIAKTDFPSLTDDQIEIVVYGGNRRKRIMGIEFPIPSQTKIPNDYQEVSRLEYTL
jgi:hypothetical protein